MPARPKNITHFRLDPDQPPTLTPEEQARLEAMPIDYSDIPQLPDDFWTRHPPVKRENKRLITLRLDTDVLTFLQEQGGRYQTRINAVLRSYMEAQSREQVSLGENARHRKSKVVRHNDASAGENRSEHTTSRKSGTIRHKDTFTSKDRSSSGASAKALAQSDVRTEP